MAFNIMDAIKNLLDGGNPLDQVSNMAEKHLTDKGSKMLTKPKIVVGGIEYKTIEEVPEEHREKAKQDFEKAQTEAAAKKDSTILGIPKTWVYGFLMIAGAILIWWFIKKRR